MNAEVTQGKALLPSGSPFGDPGPHGDLFEILGPQKVPIFLQGPHYLHFRLKHALLVSGNGNFIVVHKALIHCVNSMRQLTDENTIMSIHSIKMAQTCAPNEATLCEGVFP